MNYMVFFKVNGRACVKVENEFFEIAKNIADMEIMCDADFGILENIEWEFSHIEDKQKNWIETSETKEDYYIFFKVYGNTCIEVSANSIEEAKNVANEEMSNTDFKELYEIDWDFVKIEDENGNEIAY